jgi:hypothetical protein
VPDPAPRLFREHAEGLSPALAGRQQRLAVVDRGPLRAARHDRLQLLGAHHRADAVRREVVVVVHQHRGMDQVLARWADARHSCILVADLAPQLVLRVPRAEPPHALRVAQLRHPVVDVEVDRPVADAGRDHAVVARRFERHAQKPLVAARPEV